MVRWKATDFLFTPSDIVNFFRYMLQLSLWQWLNILIVFAAGFVAQHYGVSITNTIFLVVLLSVFLFNIDARTPIKAALVCLIMIILVLVAGKFIDTIDGNQLSEMIAVWVYYLLAIGVLKQVKDFMFEKRGNNEEEEQGDIRDTRTVRTHVTEEEILPYDLKEEYGNEYAFTEATVPHAQYVEEIHDPNTFNPATTTSYDDDVDYRSPMVARVPLVAKKNVIDERLVLDLSQGRAKQREISEHILIEDERTISVPSHTMSTHVVTEEEDDNFTFHDVAIHEHAHITDAPLSAEEEVSGEEHVADSYIPPSKVIYHHYDDDGDIQDVYEYKKTSVPAPVIPPPIVAMPNEQPVEQLSPAPRAAIESGVQHVAIKRKEATREEARPLGAREEPSVVDEVPIPANIKAKILTEEERVSARRERNRFVIESNDIPGEEVAKEERARGIRAVLAKRRGRTFEEKAQADSDRIREARALIRERNRAALKLPHVEHEEPSIVDEEPIKASPHFIAPENTVPRRRQGSERALDQRIKNKPEIRTASNTIVRSVPKQAPRTMHNTEPVRLPKHAVAERGKVLWGDGIVPPGHIAKTVGKRIERKVRNTSDK